jgi:hypothetical protein
MKSRMGTIDWEVCLGDNDELEIVGSVVYYLTPGHPGCHTLNNGDPGFPPTPSEIDFFNAQVIEMKLFDQPLNIPSDRNFMSKCFDLVDQSELAKGIFNDNEEC